MKHNLLEELIKFQSYGEIESNRRFVVVELLYSILFAKFFEISIDSDVA